MGGHGQTVVTVTPKTFWSPIVRLTYYASLTKYRLTWPSSVNGTRPETHARMDFMSSHQYGQLRYSGDIKPWTLVTLYSIQYEVVL